MTLTPKTRYEQDLQQAGFLADAAQANAVEQLDLLHQQLVEYQNTCMAHRGLKKWMNAIAGKAPIPPKGLYFWGGVGRGKTYLMDAFFETLPFENKLRTHFHRFMRRVHQELKSLDQQDPLPVVADRLADEALIICFDEFFVADITDAMILANLLEALFERGVVLVATSNIEPAGLYKDGLQRARFLPAIALLEKYTHIVNVDGGVDYRLRTLQKTQLFHTPINPHTHQALLESFNELVPGSPECEDNKELDIESRPIKALKVADDVAWFHFRALCDGPRSQNDYIELAKEYHAVLIEGVPALGGQNDDMAKRFIYLVDEFYDRNVKLILSSEKPLLEIYSNGRLEFEFQRTLSRLQEMQSEEYLARPHKA